METTESFSSNGEAESSWTPEAEALLGKWRNRVYAAQSAYYLQAERLWRWHYILGIAVVIMSTVVGGTMFTDTSGETGIPDVVIGALGSLAAILAGLQTFLKLAETATRHAVAAAWYSAIRRDIEGLQVLPPNLRGDQKAGIEAIRKDMNKVSQNAPALNEHLWARVAQRFSVDEPPLSEP